MKLPERVRPIDQVYEDLDIAEEVYYEINTQHLSECSLYGDSWPGACDDVQQAWDIVCRIKRELKSHPDLKPSLQFPASEPPVPSELFDDIPF